MALGMIPFESLADTGEASVDIGEIVGAISGSPFGGQTTAYIAEVNGQVDLQWGLGLGSILLLLSGIILVISGVLEKSANTEFFKLKTIETPKKEKIKKPKKKTEK
jgi:hypothetical protein